MIDLIIPYYNNPEGLERTLESINYDIFDVTVIDDNSAIPYESDSVTVIHLDKNSGPGVARQTGIDNTKHNYFMFLDTGDVFISKDVQKEVADAIKQYPNANMIMFTYYFFDELTPYGDNRTNGKLYKRSFINRYGITFCNKSSYMNEDVGFNRNCRVITDAIHNPVPFIETPIVKCIYEEGSLSTHDDDEPSYHFQNYALSLVSMHGISICDKNNIDARQEINDIAVSLYYWFCKTIAERPEFAQDSWAGARVFYLHYGMYITPNNLQMTEYVNNQCHEFDLPYEVDLPKFVTDIKQYANVPNWYLP